MSPAATEITSITLTPSMAKDMLPVLVDMATNSREPTTRQPAINAIQMLDRHNRTGSHDTVTMPLTPDSMKYLTPFLEEIRGAAMPQGQEPQTPVQHLARTAQRHFPQQR